MGNLVFREHCVQLPFTSHLCAASASQVRPTPSPAMLSRCCRRTRKDRPNLQQRPPLYPSSSLLNLRWPYPPCRVSNATKCSATGLHSPNSSTGYTLLTHPASNSQKHLLLCTPILTDRLNSLLPSPCRAFERPETSPPSKNRGPQWHISVKQYRRYRGPLR